MLAALARRASGSAAASSALSGASRRAASQWLQGRPPAVDKSAGTLAAFYYDRIRDAAIPTRDHLVASGQDERFTVSSFDKQVYAYAVGMLEGLGLKRGHRVGTWMTNELEQLVVQYACGLLGVAVVSIDPAVGFAGLLKVVKDEQLRTLVLSPRYGGADRVPELVDVFLPEILPVTAAPGYEPFESKRFRDLKQLVCTSREFTDGVVRFRDVPVYGNGGEYDSDDIAAVQSYVSKGDTLIQHYAAGAGADAAAVKGPGFSHTQVLASARAAAGAMALTPTDVVVSTAPLHVPGAFAAGALAAASAGAKLVLPGKDFDAAATLDAATLLRATALVASPAHVGPLAAALAADAAGPRKYDLAGLRTGLVVGSGAAPSTLGSARLAPFAAQ